MRKVIFTMVAQFESLRRLKEFLPMAKIKDLSLRSSRMNPEFETCPDRSRVKKSPLSVVFCICLLIFALFTSVNYSQDGVIKVDARKGSVGCTEFVEYRDNGLLRDFDRAARKYQISAQAKEDLKKIKAELTDENKWQMSSTGQGFAQLMQFLVTTTTLIQNVVPASRVAKTGSSVAMKLYKDIQTIQDVQSIAEDSQDYIEDKILELHPVGALVKTVADTAADIKKHAELDRDWKQYRATVLEQVTNLDKMIARYDEEQTTGKAKLEKVNELKSLIDAYLNTNCKTNSKNTEIFQLLQSDHNYGQERDKEIERNSKQGTISQSELAEIVLKYARSNEDYVRKSSSINDSQLPAEFQVAWRRHLNAWKEYVVFLKQRSSSLTSLSTGSHEEFVNFHKKYIEEDQKYFKPIEDTWIEVEKITKQYGVVLPK